MDKTNHPKLEEFQTKTIHEFSKTLEMFGLAPGDARLFITLYINPSPMTLDEMSEFLGKSKTSMSTGIRSLLDQGLVERVWVKGVRKDLYQANEELYRSFLSSFIENWVQAANEHKNNISHLQMDMRESHRTFHKENIAEQANYLYERTEEMKIFHEWIAEAFCNLIDSQKK
ncbi:GbsR/MarR family transcriptional regulator [Salimicrobium flavidum]|uniref:HTH-type transcriptional regulator n=1 Tax=Salimicrobium flavidum TaxID=570947 RepID=A0A1N7JDK5_9BACI|nr:MarR family transcriptional regulator [Salimicrobium flavidum]SIS47433.1 DNA-binding transcriptional regulator GbsR, MarR family [Salimicrobium flavidum]